MDSDKFLTMRVERPSPLTYNKPDLRNASFVIGPDHVAGVAH